MLYSGLCRVVLHLLCCFVMGCLHFLGLLWHALLRRFILGGLSQRGGILALFLLVLHPHVVLLLIAPAEAQHIAVSMTI